MYVASHWLTLELGSQQRSLDFRLARIVGSRQARDQSNALFGTMKLVVITQAGETLLVIGNAGSPLR